MLSSVMEEMVNDSTFPAAAPKPMTKAEPAAAAPAPLNHAPRIDAEQVEAMLASRDAQITELQQAVVELSDAPAVPADLSHRISALEARIDDQEQSVRHVLTILIEWIEGDERRAA